MDKEKQTFRMIAEVDLKCKKANFYHSGGHLASCYPDNKKSTMTINVYRYISGELKTFNNHHYFFMEYDGIPITSENLIKLEEQALGIARAQIHDKKLANNKNNI